LEFVIGICNWDYVFVTIIPGNRLKLLSISLADENDFVDNIQITNSNLHVGRQVPQKLFHEEGHSCMFFSAMPVPLTTARSGSSATCTGSFILWDISFIKPPEQCPAAGKYSRGGKYRPGVSEALG